MKILKYICLVALLASFWHSASAQSQPLLGQYFQNLPAYAPALTGANDFLDLRLSTRQQWSGFEGAPRTYYVSGYAMLRTYNNRKRPLFRTSLSERLNKKMQIKHGVGGYIQSNKFGPLSQFEAKLNYAVHVPVFAKSYLSMGVSGGISSNQIDLSEVTVKNDINDPTYVSYMQNGNSNTYLEASLGLALYSDKYYFSYTMAPVVNTQISGNDNVEVGDKESRHQAMLGLRMYLNKDFELVPNVFARYDQTAPVLYDAGARLRYLQKYWAGLSYRNDETLIGMVGITVNDLWRLSYSYEYDMGDFSNYHSGTHEIVIGLQLYNYNGHVPMW
ncbi:type IX secretion system membrane protein PorP/SprF [Fulvivirga sp. RKSG066]|uniref:PorP/SprF family type IX secretion system membrane protein n=1 Tax=Fulvivirga aurantia TaxID=2529383 RepID=UPI0012BB82C7|nr:type IX secretion system membrane protein PorP/SprF [Fulvivirga aurantia]MTI22325.1 type IX secretion system membrane protein PorP/SprF [Fulvivirga aurantia]